MKLEIVSHCWHYAPQLTYQLGSLVLFPPQVASLTVTVWFCQEDDATRAVIEYFSEQNVPGITWSFRRLPKERLFRRAIGRNLSALESTADWIWFADADMCFREGSLDYLSQLLAGVSADIVFPRTIRISASPDVGDQALDLVAGRPCIRDIDPTTFVPHHYRRAIGGVQIVRGDTARRIGYCKHHRRHQSPLQRWRRTYEDIAFRRTIGHAACAVELPGIYRIRHAKYARRDEYGNLRPKVRTRNGRCL